MSTIPTITPINTNFQKFPLDKQKKEDDKAEFQGRLKDHLTANEKKLINTQAGYIASQFEIESHPKIYLKNILTAGSIIAVISNIAKYLMTGKLYSNLDDSVTMEDVIKNAPLYKMGAKLSKKAPAINDTAIKLSQSKKELSKIFSKNKTFKQISDCYKEGTKVTWSMGKLYEEGKKGYEAYDDMLSHLSVAQFKDSNVQKKINEILQQVNTEKITTTQAGKQIIKSGILDKVSANEMKNISTNPPTGINKIANKIFGVENNLANSYARAKFFNGKNKELGKVPNFLNKAYLLISDTIGGGSFGGGLFAITMGIFGFVTAINAVTKTSIAMQEKKKRIQEEIEAGHLTKEEAKKMQKQPWCGEKFSAFAEDLFGFTVGSCLVLYPLGKIINKSMGFSNLGRDAKAIQKAAKTIGVNGKDKLYQRSVIKYNKTLQDTKTAQKCKKMLDGKFSLIDKIKSIIGMNPLEANIAKLGINITENTTTEELKKLLDTKIINKETAMAQRELLQNAGKSKLTIKSIFKANEVNDSKKAINRFGRYIIQKPLEIGAKMLGPDKFLMYKPNTNLGNRLYNAGAKVIDIGGGVGRIALVGLGLSSPCRKILMKMSHFIFGKPTFSQYDETVGQYKPEKLEETKKAIEIMKNPKFIIPQSYLNDNQNQSDSISIQNKN